MQKTKHDVTEVVSLVKMAVNLLGVSSSLNPFDPADQDRFFFSVDPDEKSHNELNCLLFWS